MGRITGVFNNDKSVELVIKGLEVLKDRSDTEFWLCTATGDFYANTIGELTRKVKGNKESKQCIACCSGAPVLSGKDLGSRFVADAEVYTVAEVKEKHHLEGETSPEILAELIERSTRNEEVNRVINVFRFLNDVEGAYACGYWLRGDAHGDDVYIARDILGLRPLCFAHTDGFAFASEKKMLEAMGYPHAIELDPRTFMSYDIQGDRLRFVKRDFFSVEPEITEEKEKIKEDLLHVVRASISRRIPRDEQFGVLFSGGLDSTLIAYLCKDMDADFVCYTVAVDDPEMKEAEDLSYAQRIAADLELPLKVKTLSVEDIERYLKAVVPLIDDTDGVKISVAVPLYAACELAKEDGVKTVFYGLGTEELFAGYERYKHVDKADLNRECLAGLLGMYDRDLYRDNVIANSHGITLRAPFLASDFVTYALKLPVAYKLTEDADKVILRELARDLGLEDVAGRKKRALQYGSNVVKAIEKLTKRNGYRYTRDYLRTFYPERDISLGCLFSSGKDSMFALWLMRKAGYPVKCLITIKSQNPESYMFHTPAVDLAALQAEALGLPLIMQETAGEKEKELEDLRAALREAQAIYGIEGVITGALWSTYQKERIERIAREENLKVFAPLWHINQETELRLVVSNFEVIFTGISAYGLNKSWLGRTITVEDVDRLVELSKKFARRGDQISPRFGGLNIAGEGGEFESLVLDGPMFTKRIIIKACEIVEEDANTARLVVKEAELVGKV